MSKGRSGPAKPDAFGAVYETVSTPDALGYEPAIKVTIRANPSKAQWQRWNDANGPAPRKPAELVEVDSLGSEEQREEARDRYTQELATYEDAKALYEREVCAVLVELLGRTVEVTPGLDFSTIESAWALWNNEELPDELWLWILGLPWDVVAKRRMAITGN